MNCQQYIFLIVEAAHGQLMDAAARDGANRHVETCAACAARLAQERSLTSALRTAAAGMKDLSAPARVEAKLFAAFQENLAASQTATADAMPPPDATPAPVALPVENEIAARALSRRRSWRTAAVATAIAASLALVALVTLYKQFTQSAPPAGVQENIAAQGTTEPSPSAPAVATLTSPAAVSVPVEQARRDRPRTAQRADSQHTALKVAGTRRPKMITSEQVIDGGSAIFAAGDDESAAADHAGGAGKLNDTESVTEFIPLVTGAPDAPPLESGQLVRVQLPRAALASLGLPLNAERGNEPVKADVLLGNDGMARAIRFVR